MDSLTELSGTLRFWLGSVGSLQERLTLAAHGKHQGTDALQRVTGEQPVDSAYSLQSIWEVGETGSSQRGGFSWESLGAAWLLVPYFQ